MINTEILIKVFKKHNLTHRSSFNSVAIINTNEIKIFDCEATIGTSFCIHGMFDLLYFNSKLNLIIQDYLRLKSRYWFDNCKYELFLTLRKIFGKDLCRFIIGINLFEINKQIIVTLEQFKNLCLRYHNCQDNEIINEVFNLCEFSSCFIQGLLTN